MRARHRLTDPVEVRLYRAREHIEHSRRLLGNGKPAVALWPLMRAFVDLRRAKERLDAADAVL